MTDTKPEQNQQQANTPREPEGQPPQGHQQGKICAILSYLLVGIVWFFADESMRKDEFVKYHVKQALGLIILSFVGSALLMVSMVLVWLMPLFQLVVFVLAIIGIINAAQGRQKPLPIIGSFSAKFNF